ncbi:hypothetical protein AB4Y30_11835 [Ornithinibacillus sp. 4-3]|uniref:Uncharacterized protein n=1 Tax=Ornithinibacillus sp. 4-3 TaxID=3231488 RepID=A0AB39HHL3_9BACI
MYTPEVRPKKSNFWGVFMVKYDEAFNSTKGWMYAFGLSDASIIVG